MMKTNRDNNGVGKHRIDSLQALRAAAFLGIFFQHADFYIQWSALGVSVFFVLSGFLLTYTYRDRELAPSVRRNAEFSLKKIRKLYPLHLVTMAAFIVMNVAAKIYHGMTAGVLWNLLGKIFLNVTLLQSWYPNRDVSTSLNGVSWYLSVMMFLYFIFPYLRAFVQRTGIGRLCLISAAVLLIEIVSCIPFIYIFGNESPVYIWFMYCFPIFRMGDFFVGCVLARIYHESDMSRIGFLQASILEILAVCMTAAVCLWFGQWYQNIILTAMHNWTTLYILPAAVWVFLFALNRGIITRMLSNKLFIWIGNLSAHLFMIHYVVTQYTGEALEFLNRPVEGAGKFILVGMELIVSIILAVGWEKFSKSRWLRKNQ